MKRKQRRRRPTAFRAAGTKDAMRGHLVHRFPSLHPFSVTKDVDVGASLQFSRQAGQLDSLGGTRCDDLGRPPPMLHFPHVDGAEHEHAQPRLADATANALGHPAAEQLGVPREPLPLGRVRQNELLAHCVGVHSNAHARQLKRSLEHRMPHENVTIQTCAAVWARGDPVVVVWSSAVVAKFSVGQIATDSHEENSSVLLAEKGFSAFWGLVRHFCDGLVGRVKCNFLRKYRSNSEL
mmetsp:Transcript_21606/g.37113  ORF Transcript_21606/g.37113 Transcript_21606/m.37113 type:complete len:237 (-) Transcript_21606:602-1312(-)